MNKLAKSKAKPPVQRPNPRKAKARKQLSLWACEQTPIEFCAVNSSLKIRGTIRNLNLDDRNEDFLFVSDSREISSFLPLLLWEKVTAESVGPLGTSVHFHPGKFHPGLTLSERGVRFDSAEEIRAATEQLRLWAKLRVALSMLNETPLVTTYTKCEVAEYSETTFAFLAHDSRQIHTLDLTGCGMIRVETAGESTTMKVSSATGHFAVTISDVNTTPEEAFKRFRSDSRMVN
jgi:hypothetical protein